MASPQSINAGSGVPACIALTGPTASGKTAAAFAVAARWDAEIISVDSALVYTGMDIGRSEERRVGKEC